MNAKQIISLLDLNPLPVEGGYFAETFQGKGRQYSAIYYLVTPESWSSFHRLSSDELFHFYLGDPVEMLLLSPDGSGKVALLGNQLEKGERPQIRVPGMTWQASKLAEGGTFALLGTTMAPGYDPEDFLPANVDALRLAYPEWKNWIDRYDRTKDSH
ncbi:MAG: cupin domain-containing protein [Saprospirales bacterium]|nr:cupin domain-containing protein [Saprospirales bacterium]